MAVNKILSDKEKFIDDVIDDFFDGVRDLEGVISKRINAVFKKYSNRDLTLTEKARAINEIQKEINNVLKNTKYESQVKKFLTSFDQIREYNKSIHKELNDITVTKKLVNDFQKARITETTDTLIKSGVSAKFTQPISKALQQNLVQGTSIIETRDIIDAMIISDSDNAGLLRRHVGQVATDSIKQFEGGLNKVIKDEFNMDAIQYVGSIIQTSRPQCIRWVQDFGGVILEEQLPEEVAWANINGSGYSDNVQLTVDNFMIVRGGFNCRHDAYPGFSELL